MNESAWMDAALALDCDLQCVDLSTATDGIQRRKVLLDSDESDIESLSAFLDEMEQLDTAALMPFESAAARDAASAWQSLYHQPYLPDLSGASAAVAMAPPPVHKKKISSTERRKRDKAELLERLVQLELRLHDLQADKQKLHSQFDGERQREQSETQRVLDTNLRIRQALALEQDRASQVTSLLDQLRAPMQALTFSDASPDLENDGAHDEAIFDKLRRNMSENHARLAPEWESGSIPFATNEALDVVADPNGNGLRFTSARMFPFKISTISDTLWRVARAGFQLNSFKTVSQDAFDQISIKEQLTIHPAGHNDVTLCTRATMKRIVRDNYVVFMWETVSDWATPFSAHTSTTQESGWVLLRPASGAAANPLSVMQSFMTMTLVDSSMPLTQLMQQSGGMLPIIIPSSQQVMLDRIQHLENCLMDDALQMNSRR